MVIESKTITIEQWLNSATLTLSHTSPSARLDAEIVLMHVLNVDRVFLMLNKSHVLSEKTLSMLKSRLDQRAAGVPIAYIIGYQGFWDFDFKVTPYVLVPRPDTELIIETAMELLNTKQSLCILDLGTGSGAIGVTLAKLFNASNVVCVDLCEKALECAKQNALLLGACNVQFVRSHWFESIEGSFDCIVSNPPYIDEQDPDLDKSTRYEPDTALFAPDHGLADIKNIVNESVFHLKENGLLCIEHGHKQGECVRAIYQSSGFVDVRTIQDYNRKDRITIGYWSQGEH